MSDLSQYDALQAKVKAAYTFHRETWAMMHPPPAEESANISRLDLIVAFSLLVIVLSSVIVSGSRTIAEFGGFIGGNIGVFVGVSAFVMLEIALVIYAFYDTKKSGGHNDRYVIRATRFGLALAFIVSVFANLHATFKGQEGTYISPVVDGMILLMLAISAPTLALISGHILGSEVVSILNRKKEAADRYRESVEEWESALNRSWDAQKARLGIRVEITPDTVSAPSLPVTVTESDKLPPSHQKVFDYLESNPDAASLDVRTLGDITGTNREAASKGRRAWIRSRQGDEHPEDV